MQASTVPATTGWPYLSVPTTAVHASYLEAMAEFRSGDPYRYHDLDLEALANAKAFADYASALAAKALLESPRPAGIVPETTLWWLEGSVYLGRLSIRHELTEALRELGGHIGYDVRPSARRRGHATAMLRAALPYAQRLGIDPALVTCDKDNVASRRVIETNGGVFDNQVGDKLRFWVPTVAQLS